MLRMDIERLLSVEASMANIYQKLMNLEKEGRKNSEEYKEQFAYLDLILPIEDALVREIYEAYPIDEILDSFSTGEDRIFMVNVISFSKLFDVKGRVSHLFIERYFEDTLDVKIKQQVEDSKIEFIYEQTILRNMTMLANQHSFNDFYREKFITLKYNGIYTYPNLFEGMFETRFSTDRDIEKYCFLYQMPYKETKEDVEERCKEEVIDYFKKEESKKKNLKQSSYNMDFYFELICDRLEAHLFNLNDLSIAYLQCECADLDIDDFLKYQILPHFDRVIEKKILSELNKKPIFIKSNLCSNIEFYKK